VNPQSNGASVWVGSGKSVTQAPSMGREIVTKVLEVSAGLIFRAGKLLITQRHAGSHLGGLWEFPGGKIEPGETPEECLARELREELGVNVEVGSLLERVEHAYPEKTVRLHFFLGRLHAGEPQPIGCAAVRWVTRADLPLFEFPAADVRLIERLQREECYWQG